ncbi:M48 family metalloprotease [Oceanobacter mangrovi]|uniref:M48 family metalloprotease n=1 Tax=Oceanobacter mangrovi TaxID=2862510 RepID=UPI001FE817E6|nr:M48 family metalloprotease [Oceanobacter mangrovi]
MQRLSATLLLASGLALATPADAASNDLPALGDAASSYVSLQQEHDLGRTWLRQLRANARTIDDPLAIEFLEDLAFRLIPYSNAPQDSFEFVVIDKAELNAFAVPGGIIGINLGILLFANDEDELAGVMAHELAHLSQRHFARQIERANQREPVAIATLLASILLIAMSDNPQAGIAGLMAGQAAEIQNQLAYSRDWEREADRIGISTLADAGFDPEAMPDMFTLMQAASRIGTKPPEFLLTHPLTMNRISDAQARADGYPRKDRQRGFDFEVLKNRARMRYQLTDEKIKPTFELESDNSDKLIASAAHFSLAEYALHQNQPAQALQQLQQIDGQYQQDPASISLLALTLTTLGQADKALEAIQAALHYFPDSYVLQSTKGDILTVTGKYADATALLRKLAEQRPTTPGVWFQLSRAAGAARQNVLAYHANAEYLYLNGKQAEAGRQMDLAIKEAGKQGDFQRQEALKERLKQISSSPQKLG